jgi:hypothetical protein
VSPERLPQPRKHHDLLGVHVRPLEAERLDVELVELALAALLRALVAEHGARGPHPHRPVVEEVVLDRRAHDAGRRFRPERQALPVAILENVHLLLDDVGDLADAAHEERRGLDERRADAAIPVLPEDRTARVLEHLPKRRGVRQDVFHAADRLEFLLHEFAARMGMEARGAGGEGEEAPGA